MKGENMEGVYKLRDLIIAELNKYGKKGDLSTGTLTLVDTLSHAAKSLNAVIKCFEEEDGEGMTDGMQSGMYRTGRGGMYGRGNAMYRNNNGNRNGMGYSRGYSRGGDGAREEIMDLLPELPAHVQAKMQKVLDEM